MNTEWRDIDQAPHGFYVSNEGKVRRRGIELRQNITDRGYARVTIAGKSESVHRLVALAFVDNPRNLPEINHIDGNKLNNTAGNLEWCTRSENMRHAYANGLHPGVALHGSRNPNWGKYGARHHQSVPVVATFADGSTKEYPCQNATAEDGFAPHKVSMCINGHRRSHRGATWRPLPAAPGGSDDHT